MAKVLLADDNAQYRAAFVQAMEALGHDATTIASGEGLIQAISDEAPDIVFLDVLMPGGGAISRLHDIRAASHDLPVVVITGNAAVFSSPIVSEGMRGANARVSKTISLRELQDIIDELTAPNS